MKYFKYFFINFLLLQALNTQTAISQNTDFTLTSDTISVNAGEVGKFESIIENLLDKDLDIDHITLDIVDIGIDFHDFTIPKSTFTLNNKGEVGSKHEIIIFFYPKKNYQNICVEMLVFSNKSIGSTNLCINMSTTNIADNINEDEFNISPNPTSDFITIQFSNIGLQPFVTGDKVQIFDMLGLEIKDLTPTPLLKGEGLRIDVSHLPAGVYFIRVGTLVEKFVKM